MSKQSYYRKRLPELIERTKNGVDKNLLVITLEVESQLGEEKYFNVLKGRRMAAEDCIDAMKQVEQLENEIGIKSDEGYFRKKLPDIIQSMKQMYDLNLEVIDMEIDNGDSDDFELDHLGEDERAIAKAMKKATGLTEDKYHAVLKARKTARTDAEWALKKIDELETLLTGEAKGKKEKKKSWSLIAAEEKSNKTE